ncbi:hypothetical protein TrRE_jg12772, partial [Triparma retinervis]
MDPVTASSVLLA